MIGVILLAHEALGTGLIASATHILGQRPTNVEIVAVDDPERNVEDIIEDLRDRLRSLSGADGILILSDIFGASHTNGACAFVRSGEVELVSGVNLPMFLRVLNHRQLPLTELVRKAVSGGGEGIISASNHPTATGSDAA